MEEERKPPGGLARERTDLAEDRTILANERTFAGWFRTGLAAIGIAVGFGALYQEMEPSWVPRAVGTALLCAAVYIFVAADRRAAAVMRRFRPDEVKAFSAMNLRLLTLVFLAATAALAAAIWLLRIESIGR